MAGHGEDPFQVQAGKTDFDADLAASGAFGELDDPELAAAIEASYRSQSQFGVEQSEDQMLAQAMHLSRLEEMQAAASAGATSAGAASAGASTDRAVPAMPQYAAGSSSSAASSSATAAAQLQPPGARLRTNWAGPRSGGINEDGEGSDAAVAGGSSRGSSREPGSPRSRAHMPRGVGDEEAEDAQLAAAIEASYAAQTEHGMVTSEEDMIQQALRLSQMEEESRQRAALKEQQEVELQESILMDQLREQEEKRRKVEEEELRALEANRAAEEERRKKAEQEAKRARVPPEPPAGEPGRVDLQIRTPEGKRVRRAFRSTDTVGQVYDYIDVEDVLGDSLGGKAYRFVSTMPRREYKDRSLSLQDAGLQGQCALLIEVAEA